MSSNWFKPPPADFGGAAAARIENAACRKALQLAGIPPARVAAAAGLGAAHTAQLTFVALREFAEFPTVPRVTSEVPDEVGKILAKFHKTRLYVAWLDLEADDSTGNDRALVFKGLTWGVSVLYEKTSTPDPDDRPYVACGRPARDLRIEPFAGWLRHTGWQFAGDDTAAGQDDF